MIVVRNFQARFVPKILAGTKDQTIRQGWKGRPGDITRIQHGSRFKPVLAGFAPIVSVDTVAISFPDRLIHVFPGILDLRAVPEPIESYWRPDDLDGFAQRDGFDGFLDMSQFPQWRDVTEGFVETIAGVPFLVRSLTRWRPPLVSTRADAEREVAHG